MRSRPKISVKPEATMNSSDAKVSPFSNWMRLSPPTSLPLQCVWTLLEVPVVDLLAGPERNVRQAADFLKDTAEMNGAMRRTHDVRVQDQSHHAGRIGAVVVELAELIHGAVVVFARLVVLDQHHRNVVAFLGIGNIDDRVGARLEDHGLVVEHP